MGFGKTALKPEEVVVSVFLPFSRQVKLDFSCAAASGPWRCADPSLPAGGGGSSFPPRSAEGELLRYRDDRDEGVLLGGIRSGSGRQHLLRRSGSEHR